MKAPTTVKRIGNLGLAVRQAGQGMPLVWGHSLMGSMVSEDIAGLIDWEEVARHVAVTRYDARGHGQSEGTTDPRDYRWEIIAGDMLALAESAADDRGAGGYVLGGISMGAATALEAAVQAPERTAGLILTLPPTAWETRPRQAAIYRRMSWVSGALGSAPYKLLDWLPKPVSDNSFSRLALATVKGLARADSRYMQATLKGAALSDLPPRSVLETLDVPTLIMAWEGDKAHPVATAEALAESLPNTHDLIITHPQDPPDWTHHIVEFMASLSTSKARRKKPAQRRRRASA
jgi:pimeloyl-ACP methyl ester carboxylesterase